MKAARAHGYGKNDVVRVEEAPRPSPGPKDLLVEVHAAGVNPVDYKIVRGGLKRIRKETFPLVLGSELSGVVVERGAEVKRFQVGDAVFARVQKDRTGTFAELALVAEEDAAKKPDGTTHVEAASIPLAGLTAWQGLTERGALAAGQTVLIHAAAGGVGVFATQLAKHLGARVIATASEKNRGFVTELGADEVIDYRTERFEERVHDCDLVFDTIGGDTFVRSLDVVRQGGRIVSIVGKPTGEFAREEGLGWPIPTILDLVNASTRRVLRRRGITHAFFMMRPDGEQLGTIGDLVAARKVRTVIDRVFPLDDVVRAFEHVEAGHTRGKVVIEVRAAK